MRDDILGYPIRPATNSERRWFADNPKIAAYASEDRAVVLNPFSDPSPIEKRSLCLNEALRLLMRDLALVPQIAITPEQRARFVGTSYARDEEALLQTVIARVATGDPSIGNPTPEQLGYARCLSQLASHLARSANDAAK